MTTEVFKRAFPAEKLLGQSTVLAIAILFLFYQERRETRETESAANRETRLIELQKANHKVLEDLTAAVKEMSLSIERLEDRQ